MSARMLVLQASCGVQRNCPVDHALRGVVGAIDALAVLLRCLDGESRMMDWELSESIRSPERTNRPNALENPYLLLGELRTLREALRSAQNHVAIGGAVYEGIEMVSASIDASATLLTGDRDYYLILGAGTPPAQREAEAQKLARERGEI